MSENRKSGGSADAAPAAPETAELPPYAERVLDVADLIPPGRVMTYGDVAEWLGDGGPRQVGRVMALYGSAVPWWRVVRADGGSCRDTNCARWTTTARRARRCATPCGTRTGTSRAST